MSQTKNMKEKPSLQDSHPELAIEADGWDAADFTFGSDKSMPWKCTIGHQWTARISDRAGGKGRCPICLGKRVLKGFNDLKTLNPNLATQAFGWDPTEISISSNKTLSWKCSLGHVWEAKPSALAKANVRHITFHELRDTAISQAIASGADVLAISRIAGHANPSITLNVYGHVLKDSMGSIQRALDETYAEMNSGNHSTNQQLSSAS